MKFLKMVGLGLASAFVMAMALAGNASAVPLWLACLEGNTPTATKYTSNSCGRVMSGSLPTRWQWNEVTATDKVRITGFTLSLTDTKAVGGSSTVRCTSGIELSGTVGPGRFDRIEMAKVSEAKKDCARVEGGCKAEEVESVEGRDLPWQTELYETEGKFFDKIGSGGKGEPGWEVSCNTLLGKQTDECESEGENFESAELVNKKTGLEELLVLGTLVGLHKFKCSQGGAGAGSINGPFAILLESEVFETETDLKRHSSLRVDQ